MLLDVAFRKPNSITPPKGAWNKVRIQAGVTDLRFHDLQHTYATRLVSKHLPFSEVGRVLGHTQPTTTYRYVNANVETARRAANALNELHASTIEPTSDQPFPGSFPTCPRKS